MVEEGFKRKLAAILSADVEGYSRLMDDDEEATVRTLTSYRTAITDLVQQFRGRVVDTPGDNILAEFTSVVDAVNCAVEIQRDLAERNAELPYNRKMEFRIGVNLGDVIEEEGRIYGDGVNIAARVEAMGEARGICISGRVYDQVANKLGLEYENLGEHQVKNISTPIRIYRVLSFPGAAAHRVVQAKKAVSKKWRNLSIASGAVVVVVAVVVGIWQFYIRRPPVEVASVDKMAYPLPDKPSIAVLPFNNLSDDPKQEYFCDGMAEDLITDLSAISGLFVIARNSTFAYKGKPIKIRQVAEELGVRYVLEGSVRKADKQIRINAQLIDATTGGHLWAKRYDGHLDDVFVLQDKVTQKIVAALAVKLTKDEQERITSKESDNIAAYEAFLKDWEYYRRVTSEDFAIAISYFKKAIELDPDYGRAYAALALTYWKASEMEWHWSLKVGWPDARLWALQYMQMALKNPTCISHRVASSMNLYRREYGKALAEAERAIGLEPNNPSANLAMTEALIFGGRPEKASDFLKRAMRLDPHNPARHLYLLGLIRFCMGQLEEAAALSERALTLNPEAARWASLLAASYGHLGHEQEAQAAYQKSRSQHGGHPIGLQREMYFWPFKNPEVVERFADGLLKAGISGRLSEYYKISEKNKLTGEEIKTLILGQRVAGSALIGGLHSQTGFPFEVISEIGKSWSKADMICTQWHGLKYCAPVFRNPEARPEMLNEFLIITDYGFVTISPVY